MSRRARRRRPVSVQWYVTLEIVDGLLRRAQSHRLLGDHSANAELHEAITRDAAQWFFQGALTVRSDNGKDALLRACTARRDPRRLSNDTLHAGGDVSVMRAHQAPSGVSLADMRKLADTIAKPPSGGADPPARIVVRVQSRCRRPVGALVNG